MKTYQTCLAATLAVLLCANGWAQDASYFGGPHMGFGPQMPGGVAPAAAFAPISDDQVAPAGAFAPAVDPNVTTADYGPLLGDTGTVQQVAHHHGGGGGLGGACEMSRCCGWTKTFFGFGEFLYLRPRNAEVPFAVEVNSAVNPNVTPIQFNRFGVTDPDYQPAFRAGFGTFLDRWSSLTAQYTMFESSSTDTIARTGVNTGIASLISHPLTAQANATGQNASADYDLNYHLIDIDYRDLFSYSCHHHLALLFGVRYANLDEEFNMNLPIQGNETVATDIDFEGAGLRFGLEGERFSGGGQFLIYGRTHASLVAGRFNASYAQGQNYDASVVNTAWEGGRIVPILDLELGIGWMSACGGWKLTGGYVYSAWYNTVKTDQWINAVQTNNLSDLSDSLTFDGLMARIEGRF